MVKKNSNRVRRNSNRVFHAHEISMKKPKLVNGAYEPRQLLRILDSAYPNYVLAEFLEVGIHRIVWFRGEGRKYLLKKLGEFA